MKPTTMLSLAQRLLDGRLEPRDYDLEGKVAGALMYAANELDRLAAADAEAPTGLVCAAGCCKMRPLRICPAREVACGLLRELWCQQCPRRDAGSGEAP